MKPFILIAFSLFFVSCGFFDSDPKPPITETEAARIIIDAGYTNYTGLPDSIRALANDESVQPVTPQSEEISKEKGYYLRMIVNNKLLAKVSTDGGAFKDSLDTADIRALYRKYRSSPELLDSKGEEIAHTAGYERYSLFKVIRNGDIDTTYWGPLKNIPSQLILHCSDLPDTTSPKAKVVKINPESITQN